MRDAPIFVDDLELPALLVELVRYGRWPSNLGAAGIRLAEDHPLSQRTSMDTITFDQPPFATIARHAAANRFWTWPCASPHEIDFAKTICIADFADTFESFVTLARLIEPGAP